MLRRLKIGCLFALWFLLSVGYSITNKRVNNLLPGVPCTVAASTVGVGSILVCTLWATGLRSAPRLSPAVVRILLPIGICHAIGHLAGTVSVAVGSVSFTQIVKAANPIYTCVLSMAVLGTRVSRRVWLSLLPIIVGVALATVKEVSFVPAAFATAAVSDLSMATRNVLSKKSMGSLTDVDGKRLEATDMFGLLTLIATLVSLPIAFAADGRTIAGAWSTATAAASANGGSVGVAMQVCLTGILFFAYNELAMKALSHVHAITHAVGNILRRVIIMLSSMIVFGTPMSHVGAAGSALAISGSFVYALTKHRETRLEAQQLKAVAAQTASDEGKGGEAKAS
jgi:solute carrier family 35 protein E1